jgi:Ca2+-binding RTX toxin-like protein
MTTRRTANLSHPESTLGEKERIMCTIFSCRSSAELQTLEARRLLAAHLAFDHDSGLLHVTGDESNDQIDVSLQVADVLGSPRPGILVTVRDHGNEVFNGFFFHGQLTEVSVEGGYGDDAISISNVNTLVNTLVSGDAGNDTIDAFVDGRPTPSRILGGEGDDLISLDAGPDAAGGYVVLGEGGNDTINGSPLDDVLYGENESVDALSIPGDDVVHGGGGNDALYGGPGDDRLFGEDGNDTLNGGEGSDMLNGGSGDDQAVVDQFDQVVNVEKVET